MSNYDTIKALAMHLPRRESLFPDSPLANKVLGRITRIAVIMPMSVGQSGAG